MDVLLYGTENARNLGSIVRTSAALGIQRVHLYDQFSLLSNAQSFEDIKKTSMGHTKDVEIVVVDDPIVFANGYDNKFATTLAKGSNRLGDPDYNVKFTKDALIMFGNETRGLPRELSRRHGIKKVAIPTKGMDYCLSLHVAYAIVMFEYLRQNPDEFPIRGTK